MIEKEERLSIAGKRNKTKRRSGAISQFFLGWLSQSCCRDVQGVLGLTLIANYMYSVLYASYLVLLSRSAGLTIYLATQDCDYLRFSYR